MKKSNPPAPPAVKRGPWPVLFVVSLAANGLLGWWALRTPPAAGPGPAPTPAPAPAVAPSPAAGPTDPPREFAAYAALGSFLAENNRIPDLKWSPGQFAAFAEGMRASYEGRGYPLDEEARRLRDDFSKQVQAMLAAEQPDPVKEYFRNLREHEAVRQTASGLHYRITLEGTGPPPSSDSVVVYSFSARLPNGTALPKLVGVRLRAAMADLLPGVREGLLLLHKGGKALIYVPAALSFGDGPWPSEVPKGEPVIFFIELHDVLPASSARG